ncbi:uncharacterized protein MEPE_02747 [Melanopsichium pennsylvanicum]|uniref:Uncharacterized protein n=1 Tax=Melanopsichium pennsylvanicum TaxID=63383 RepID=A0AAJ4XJT4_9BASI|nr:uncharacterized protein MEPE_02747 [Melanopsichium pennsylvanicum]
MHVWNEIQPRRSRSTWRAVAVRAQQRPTLTLACNGAAWCTPLRGPLPRTPLLFLLLSALNYYSGLLPVLPLTFAPFCSFPPFRSSLVCTDFPLLAARARLVLSHASLLLRPYFGNPLARPVVMIPFAARTKELRVAGPRPSWCQKAEDVNAVMRKGVLVTRICRHRVLGSLLKLHMQKCWVRPIPSSDFAS